MKKRTYSPETVKTLSTLSVALIFMIIVLYISGIFTKRMLKNAEDEYFANMQTILDGYASIVSVQLKNYVESLEAFRIAEYFDSEDELVVAEFLKKYGYKKNQDFNAIYFITPEGRTYTTDGNFVQLDPDQHSIFKSRDQFYISDMSILPNEKSYSFRIEEKVYTTSGKFRGVLGASVNVDRFNSDNLGIKLGTHESFMLIDRNGLFLLHERKDVIGLSYTPTDGKYIATASKNLALSGPGIYLAQADSGDMVYILTTKIPEAEWTIGLRVTTKELNAIFKVQRRSQYKIIALSVIIIFILVLVEAWIVKKKKKKQLIATVYDPLTNLWTRQRFESEATKQIRYSPRAKFILIEADIRGFKFINQNYGEEAADEVILNYSKILNEITKEFHGIIGRGFADHFYILIKISSVRKSMNIFKEKMEEITETLKEYEIPFFPKFGVSFLMPGDKSRGVTIQGLIGQASFAKSTIKDNMLTQYSVYNSRLLEKINEERFIEAHMQQALDDKEFFVMYQPKISLSTDKIVGAEALVRWNSPKLGLMTPDKFIPLFERNGFITKLDFFVYEEVFKFLHNMLAKNNTVVPISVNMSRNHNKPEKFIHEFIEAFNRYSIPPELIQVEILERSVMDSSTLGDITNKLHKEGFTVAMDDFGSGESSLNMLTSIPVDVLKFDREFLNSSTNSNGEIDTKSAKFIQILIDLGKNLEKQTVFEGVETQAQRDFLRSIDCDQAQGFFYSRPLSEQDFVQFIKLHS